MSDSKIPQHKRLAMGERAGFKKGGSVGTVYGTPKPPGAIPPKTGFNETPITKVKKFNGVKGV
jgi:hypothetical protein